MRISSYRFPVSLYTELSFLRQNLKYHRNSLFTSTDRIKFNIDLPVDKPGNINTGRSRSNFPEPPRHRIFLNFITVYVRLQGLAISPKYKILPRLAIVQLPDAIRAPNTVHFIMHTHFFAKMANSKLFISTRPNQARQPNNAL